MRVASRVELSIWGTIHGLARLTSNMQGLNLVILSPFECNFMWANPFNPQLRYMSLWIKLFENFEILTFGFFFSIFTLSLIRYFSSPNLAIIDTFFITSSQHSLIFILSVTLIATTRPNQPIDLSSSLMLCLV